MRPTRTEQLNAKNAKAIAKMRAATKADAELHAKVRRGEMTAAEALRSKVKERKQ